MHPVWADDHHVRRTVGTSFAGNVADWHALLDVQRAAAQLQLLQHVEHAAVDSVGHFLGERDSRFLDVLQVRVVRCVGPVFLAVAVEHQLTTHEVVGSGQRTIRTERQQHFFLHLVAQRSGARGVAVGVRDTALGVHAGRAGGPAVCGRGREFCVFLAHGVGRVVDISCASPLVAKGLLPKQSGVSRRCRRRRVSAGLRLQPRCGR